MVVITPGWFAVDRDTNASPWPHAFDDNTDEGTAQTMCDIFNARDYPEEFSKE